MTEEATPAKVRLTDGLGPMSPERDLVERLRLMSRRWHWPLLGDEAADEIERLRATLRMVADIAHSGGSAGHDTFSALTAIRRLTMDAWNPHGTQEDHRERVREAGREAVRRSGA